MTLYKYISLNIVSIISYIMLLLIVFTFYLQLKFDILFLTLEQFFSVYTFFIYLSIIFLIIFFGESYLRKKYFFSNFKIKIENDILKNIFIILFNFGFYFALFNIVIFIIAFIFLFFVF